MATEKKQKREMTRAQKRATAHAERGFQRCEKAIKKLAAGNVTATLCIKDRWNPFRRTTVHLDNIDDEILKALQELLKIRKAQHTTKGAMATYEYFTGEPMNPEMIRKCYASNVYWATQAGG